MDVLEIAKNIEKEGIEHYTELAETTTLKELAGIFKFLADEEQKHYNTFNAYQNSQSEPEFESIDIIAKAKTIFESFANVFKTSETIYDYEAAYQKALTLEEKSITFYEELLSKNQDDKQSTIIKFVLEEEKNHKKVIGAIIDFVKRPKEWLENAEWNHLDEY